jgi:hypothetical protein
MLASQNHVCAVCGEKPGGGSPLAVDHCHVTGRVRALLCTVCNFKLGAYEAFRERAEAFLSKYGDGNPLLTHSST